MRHFETECAVLLQNVWYWTGALWNLCNRPVMANTVKSHELPASTDDTTKRNKTKESHVYVSWGLELIGIFGIHMWFDAGMKIAVTDLHAIENTTSLINIIICVQLLFIRNHRVTKWALFSKAFTVSSTTISFCTLVSNLCLAKWESLTLTAYLLQQQVLHWERWISFQALCHLTHIICALVGLL